MRLAFNSWTSAAEEHSTAVRRLGVALGEWQGANLRRAWLTWLDGHVAVYRLRGVVMSIRNRYTRRALNSWAAACDDLARWAAVDRVHVSRTIIAWVAGVAFFRECQQ